MKKIFLLFSILIIITANTSIADGLRTDFQANNGIIYTLNIRNFGAIDKNNDGIINKKDGDISGSFLNAKDKLSELKQEGINTIYLLPITKVGKIKALGTAGSLYAMDSFNEINPQLDETDNDLSVYQEAKLYIEKAHSLNMKVIVDLPSCASYDLIFKKPNWLMYDKNDKAMVPADWTDVRLFKIYNEDKSLNQEMLTNFKNFVDLTQNLGFDGIRADVAAIKPYDFWKNIIDHARKHNNDFLFIAEASPDWSNPAPNAISHYTTIDELLNSGFDCYYGSWSDFKNIKSKKEFDKKIIKNLKILKKHKNKSLMASFATHDQQAPILRGENYWNMILWLSVTMPVNSYFLDGFSYGDNYIYPYENKKAKETYTDDEFYFVHSGMFDIFNLSAPCKKTYPHLKQKYINAINFKKNNIDLFKNGKFKILNTKNDKVFAYSIKTKTKELIAIGSLDENLFQEAYVKPNFKNSENAFSIINSKYHPQFKNGTIKTIIEPLDIQIYLINQANSLK